MRIPVVFILLTVAITAFYCKGNNTSKHTLKIISRDTVQPTSQVIRVKDLTAIFKLKEKSEQDVLAILRQANTNWTFSGQDKREIAFSIKEPKKGLVSWKFAENALVYYILDSTEYISIGKELLRTDYSPLGNTANDTIYHLRFYKKDDMLIKIVEVPKLRSQRAFICTVQSAGQ